MSKCELCKNTARVYCESDEARLCWSCDKKVHTANFLVARHVRKLLCHSCQSPTAWSGSGKKLGRTVSICEPCVVTSCVKHADEKVESEGLSSSQLPPPVSCSSSEDRSQIDINVSLKRSRDFVIDLNSKLHSYAENLPSLKPLKFRKLEVNETRGSRPQVNPTGTRIRQHVDMNKRMIVDFDLNERPCDKHK